MLSSNLHDGRYGYFSDRTCAKQYLQFEGFPDESSSRRKPIPIQPVYDRFEAKTTEFT